MDRFWTLHKDEVTGPKSPWKKALGINNDKFSITLYQRPSDITPTDTMRFDAKFKNVNKEAWFEMIKEGPPIKNLKSKRIVRQESEYKKILHLIINMPIMTNRE
jgi:hypothetical protein